MGSVVIAGSTSGTVTITPPAEAGTRTITLPAATGTAILEDGSNNLQMNSGFGSSATAYGCRAWVNFNGTGTVAIRDSGNVSSITDNGTGYYTINFANAMPDADYAAAGKTNVSASWGYSVWERGNKATANYTIQTAAYNASVTDTDQVSVAIFR